MKNVTIICDNRVHGSNVATILYEINKEHQKDIATTAFSLNEPPYHGASINVKDSDLTKLISVVITTLGNLDTHDYTIAIEKVKTYV